MHLSGFANLKVYYFTCKNIIERVATLC